MDLSDIVNLIKVRDYVINSLNLPVIERKTVNELNGILLLLDEKIIGMLTDTKFKEFIGYKDVQLAKERAARITNIYSGISGKK